MTVRRRWVVAGAACALVATSAGIASAVSQQRAQAQPDLKYVKAQIDKFRAVPTFVAPGPAIDASKAKGKKVAIIPASSNVPFVNTIAEGMTTVGGKAGLVMSTFKNQGTPSEWVQGMTDALTQGVDSIDLLAGLDPKAVSAQVTQATSRGKKVVVTHLYDVNQKVDPAVSAATNIPYEQAGRLLADWAILKTKGKTNALVTIISQVNSTQPMLKGIKGEFKTRCGPSCKITTIDSTIANLGKLQAQVQSALTRDPKINYVINLYDSAQAPQTEAAIKALKRKLNIVTFNGTPDILKLIKPGSIIAMDVGENLDWIAYGAIDQHLRLLTGAAPTKNPNLPIRVFDASNVKQAGSPPVNGKGFGSGYQAAYLKLWGLQ